MERKDVERVEKELDEILQIMEPASFLQGSGTEKLTGEQMENTREELAVSRRPETEGQNKISGDGRGGRPPRRSGGKSIRIPENGRKETEREKEAEKETGKESGAAEAWLDEDFGDGGDFEEIAEEIQEELEIRRDGFEERQREDSGGRFTSTGEFLRLLKPTDAYLAAFFFLFIVMVIIFAQRGIFPFGEESFLRTDMYHQYAPFFSEFQYKLTQGGSLLYSWDVGMGVNFSALYAYYLASPFNWLLVLCPKDMIIEFMSYGIVLKIGLAGLSFTWYLKRHCKTRDFGAGFFGIFYALSGYVAAYSWNIMWLDCIILLPLILLGLERLVKGGKPYLYCLALGASILSNYYISIMICLFLVLYMAALLILEPPKGVKAFFGACGKFAVFSLAAGGLAAVVLLPEIYALKSTASGNFDFPDTVTSYFSIFDMLARHLVNVQTEQGLDHWPNLYCGTAALIFFLLFLVCKKIRLREKIVYGSLLFLFLASFAINVLNFTWHGFHYPNSLPCRQSFIYIALMLLVCYRAYMYLGETPLKHVGMAFMGASVFVLLAQKMVDNTEQFHFSVYYVSLLLLAAYSGLIYLYRTVRRGKELVLLTALALVSVESAVNTTVTSVPTTSRTAYTDDNQDVEALLACTASGSNETVDAILKEKILTIGENIKIRRFARYEGAVTSYVHAGGRIGVIVKFDTTDDIAATEGFKAYAHNVAMQIAAMNAEYLDEASVPAERVEKEKEILTQQIVDEGKPQNIAEKIVAGRLNKFFKEICLVDQVYVQDSSMTVKQYTESVAKELGGDIKIAAYTRFEKGEGLEKRQDDFAAEVAGMVK